MVIEDKVWSLLEFSVCLFRVIGWLVGIVKNLWVSLDCLVVNIRFFIIRFLFIIFFLLFNLV